MAARTRGGAGDNGLTTVSPEIGRLRRLHTLDLARNALTDVPDEVGGLPPLTEFLYLHDNRLTGLPAALGRLTRLRYLCATSTSARTVSARCRRPSGPCAG